MDVEVMYTEDGRCKRSGRFTININGKYLVWVKVRFWLGFRLGFWLGFWLGSDMEVEVMYTDDVESKRN